MKPLLFVLVIAGCGSDGLPGAGDGGLDASGGCHDTGHCLPDCSTLGESACKLRPDCRADTCPTCQGGTVFAVCSRNGDPAIACGLDCPAPCSITTDATSCNARPDCHAVFQPAGACGCATAGCCIHFDHCADGPARCTGQPACAIPSPICDGPYVISYTQACYEGCVLASECK